MSATDALSHTWDVLVVGAGAAGLRAAIAAHAAGARTLVVDRGTPGRAGTTVAAASDWMAFGAAFGHRDPEDSPEQHGIDIRIKGGLCLLPRLACRIAEDAPARLMDIEAYGERFDRAADGTYLQVHSDGATYARACGRGADTGPMMIRALMAECDRRGIERVGGLQLIDLAVSAEGAVVGASLADAEGRRLAVRAAATVLATGGAGQIFEHNALPAGMYGSGYAAALRAGARLANMEFIQIGPCIGYPVKFALSGIFWRMNPRLTNGMGQELLLSSIPPSIDIAHALHIKGHSFPFTVRNDSVYIDVAIYREIAAGRGGPHGGVFIDVSHNPREELERRAAVPLEHLLARGIDFRERPMEFAPSIQHCNGGILIDERAAADLPGLFAAGEAAGGQHGADRPGGNALADSQVFGHIAGHSAAEHARQAGAAEATEAASMPGEDLNGRPVAEVLDRVRRAMWVGCSVVRTDSGLAEAQAAVDEALATPVAGSLAERLDLRDALTVARTHLASARRRTESRGTHLRADHPVTRDPEWIRVQTVAERDGALVVEDIVPEVDEAMMSLWQSSPENRREPLLGFE